MRGQALEILGVDEDQADRTLENPKLDSTSQVSGLASEL
jgi:hypothetical protein